MTYSVAATWTAHPGSEGDVEEVLSRLAAATREEPGNVLYVVSRIIDRPGAYLLYELYVDGDAYAAHQASPHFQELAVNLAIPQLLASRERVFSVVLDESSIS